jgi:MFS family permease
MEAEQRLKPEAVKRERLPHQGLPPNYRHNFWCLALDFCFFGIAMAFFNPSTVTPSFLTELGASTSVIGLMSTLQRAGWLVPQLFAARYLANKPFKKPYILLPAGISRTMLLVIAGLIWATQARPPSLVIAIVIGVSAIFWLGDGMGSVAWFDFLSKTIPPERRGRMTGTGQVLSGVMGFLAGFAVEWILGDQGPAYPNNYALLYLLAFIMLAISFTAITFGREPKGHSTQSVPKWSTYVQQLVGVLKEDKTFRRYVLTRQIFNLSALATPFYMTYALDKLGLPTQVAGRYTAIGVIGTIISALLFGWANERHGSHTAMSLSLFANASVPALALLIPRLLGDPTVLAWAYGLVFLAYNLAMASFMPSWIAYILELAPETQRPVYIGMTNTFNSVSALVSTLGGLILQWTDQNYVLLFAMAAIGTLAALPLLRSLPKLREPVGGAPSAST